MKIFKIFIASSNDEIEERESIKVFLSSISNVTRNYGIEFLPVMWELESVNFIFGFSEKQNEYNELLISSDMVFFIFGKRVGKYTYEEFITACEQIKNNEALKMYAYFKQMELGTTDSFNENDNKNIEQVINLKKYISKTLKQVYGEFESVSELQSKITTDILKATLPILNQEFQYCSSIKKLANLYSESNSPFQIEMRDTIVSDAINSLFFLNKYNLAPGELKQKNFYEILHSIIAATHVGSEIKAISVMLKSEWDNSENEKKFWSDNQNAVKRHVNLERIFIVNKNEAHRLKTIPQIKNHISLQNQSEFIHSYVVEKEVLLANAPLLLEQAKNGFIMINSLDIKIVFFDEMPGSDRRAIPVIDKQIIDEVTLTFNSIKKYAIHLEEYLNDIAWSHYKKEMISIFVTTKCNLNCDYCFTNKNQYEHKGQTISFEFVKKGISDYFETNYMRHVRFFGAGEPTVEFDLLKKIHQYAVEIGGEAVTFEIQTNGTFSDSIAIWLKNNINIIWISCDGTPDIQNIHRPFLNDERKTSDVIEKNIRILCDQNSKSFVGMRSTITTENVLRQIELIDYFYSLGITNIWVDPIFPSVGNSPMENENDFNVMLFAEKFLEAVEYAYTKGIFYGSILTCNFNDCVNKHCRACLPVPHLTTDGYVSACDMALFGKDKNHMSPLIYGEWDENNKKIIYNSSKIEFLQTRTTENMQHCEMCTAKEHCGGYCLGEVLNETGDLFGQKKAVCQAIRYLDKNLQAKFRKYKYTHP